MYLDVRLAVRYAFGKLDYLPLSLVETLLEARSSSKGSKDGSHPFPWDGWLLNRQISATFAANDWNYACFYFLQTMSLFDLFSFFHYPFSYLPYFFSPMLISKNLRKSVLDWFSILFFKSQDHLAFEEIHRRDEWDQMDPAAWSVLSYSLALNQAGRPWVQRWGMPVMNGVVLTFGTKLRWNMKHHEPFWVILFQILHFGVYDIWIYMVYRYTALSCTPNCRNLIHEKLGIDQWRIHGNGSSWKLGIPQHPH